MALVLTLRLKHITSSLALPLSVVMDSELFNDYLGYRVTGFRAIDAAIPAEGCVKHPIDSDTFQMKDGAKVALHGMVTPERGNRRECPANPIAGTVNRL